MGYANSRIRAARLRGRSVTCYAPESRISKSAVTDTQDQLLDSYTVGQSWSGVGGYDGQKGWMMYSTHVAVADSARTFIFKSFFVDAKLILLTERSASTIPGTLFSIFTL